jgi:hypothetical protein
VPEPLLATADQRLVLGHPRVIELPAQSNGDGVTFRVSGVALEKVIGSYRDRDLLPLVNVDDRQSVDLHHTHNTIELTHYMGRLVPSVIPHSTFGKSGHFAPHRSLQFAVIRFGQSAAISSSQSSGA